MTGRIRAIVAEAHDGSDTLLAPDLLDAIDAADGDVIRITDGDGGDVTVFVRSDAKLAAGRIALGTDAGAGVTAAAGDAVLIEPVEPSIGDTVRLAPVPQLSVQGGETYVRDSVDRPLSAGDEVPVDFFDGSLTIPLRVVETHPPGPVTVEDRTTIELEAGPAPGAGSQLVTPTTSDAVGGYDTTVEELDATVVRALTAGQQYDRLGGTRRAGVLLTGPQGVGKTHLLGHAVWRANATAATVDATTLTGMDRGAIRDRLDAVSGPALADGPAVVHVDGLDAFCSDVSGQAEIRAFRAWLRQFATVGDVVVVGEARESEAVSGSLTQGELLSRRVPVRRPTASDRAAVLSTLMDGTPIDRLVEVGSFGRRALGYVAGDLLALRSRAIESAVDRTVRNGDRRPVVTDDDMETALEETAPQAMAAERTEVPDTSFDDIGGLEGAKRELLRAVEWPLRHNRLFEQLGLEPVSGVLLYGPPGTGKTMLARAVASTTDANFLSVSGPELMNKFVGESERAVRTVFEQARASAPAVIFFDEVDGLGSARSTDADGSAPERVVSQLLTEMDGLTGDEGVTVVGATNRPDRLDDALLRPGRFDRLVEVGIPDEQSRVEIFQVHARDRPIESVDWEQLAAVTDGYTGSDIAAVVREAGLLALEEHVREAEQRDGRGNPPTIRRRHLEQSLKVVDASVSPDKREYYRTLGERLR